VPSNSGPASKWRIGAGEDDLVFCDAAGEPLWGRHLTTLSFKAILRRAGLPLIPFHDLRHTFATLQLAAGTNPKIVSEVLGHKEVAITLDRYSHALPTLQTTAMARLDAILGRGDDAAPKDELDKGSNKGSPPSRQKPKGPIRTQIGPQRARLVPHTGFEPVISALRGRCPRPLDECGVGRRVGTTTTADRIPNDPDPVARAILHCGVST
jgi:Phage integrase family